VDLRRALLLFAIVLGAAAIASSIARSPERDRAPASDTTSEGAPQATEAVATAASPRATRAVTVRAGRRLRAVELSPGRPLTLIVAVKAPGQVEIPRLGLIEDAEPLTPARFDLLVSSPGRYLVSLRRASDPERHEGVAVVTVARRSPR
jgi:hypothetical protein